MDHPFPPASAATEQARAIQRLRRAVGDALYEGENTRRRGTTAARLAEPMLVRLADIGRELDRLAADQATPFRIESERGRASKLLAAGRRLLRTVSGKDRRPALPTRRSPRTHG